MAEIGNLWKLLQTPQNDIDQFLSHCPTTVSDDAISYVSFLMPNDA